AGALDPRVGLAVGWVGQFRSLRDQAAELVIERCCGKRHREILPTPREERARSRTVPKNLCAFGVVHRFVTPQGVTVTGTVGANARNGVARSCEEGEAGARPGAPPVNQSLALTMPGVWAFAR